MTDPPRPDTPMDRFESDPKFENEPEFVLDDGDEALDRARDDRHE